MEKVDLPPYEEMNPSAPQSMYPPLSENIGSMQPQMMQPQMFQPQPSSIVLQNMPPGGYPAGPITHNYGPTPQNTLCQFCNTRVKTTVENKSTTRTHCMALCLCCFMCYLCMCLPYCMDSCQNQNHYCPQCKTFLGSYEH